MVKKKKKKKTEKSRPRNSGDAAPVNGEGAAVGRTKLLILGALACF